LKDGIAVIVVADAKHVRVSLPEGAYQELNIKATEGLG
jgi:hypothetical protein